MADSFTKETSMMGSPSIGLAVLDVSEQRKHLEMHCLKTSLFLEKIPTEIRLNIYRFVLHRTNKIKLLNLKQEWDMKAATSLSILRTCKQIFSETRPILYHENSFLYVNCTGFADVLTMWKIPPAVSSQVKHLTIETPRFGDLHRPYCPPTSWTTICIKFPLLEILTLDAFRVDTRCRIQGDIFETITQVLATPVIAENRHRASNPHPSEQLQNKKLVPSSGNGPQATHPAITIIVKTSPDLADLRNAPLVSWLAWAAMHHPTELSFERVCKDAFQRGTARSWGRGLTSTMCPNVRSIVLRVEMTKQDLGLVLECAEKYFPGYFLKETGNRVMAVDREEKAFSWMKREVVDGAETRAECRRSDRVHG